MSGYNSKLRDGREVYIPNWTVEVSLANLTKAGQYLGTDNILLIADLNFSAVIVAIMKSREPEQAASLIKHFVCQARLDGEKILPSNIDKLFENDLSAVAEIFAHVIHSQYSDFFELGLVKVSSQES